MIRSLWTEKKQKLVKASEMKTILTTIVFWID